MDVVIGFSKARSEFKLGSKIIQLAEKRPYSHAYIRFPHPITGSHLIAQASHGYVNLINYKYFTPDNLVIKEYRLQCNDDQFKRILLKYIMDSVGKKYGYFQLILIAIKKLIRLQFKTYNVEKYQICSEFAANVCKLLKINVPGDLDYVTPSDLEQILIDNNVQRII